MPSHKKNTQYFDDDFEVTYEEEIPFHYNTSNVDLNTDSVTPYYADDFEDAYDDDRYEEEYDDAYEDCYDEDYDDEYDAPYNGKYDDEYEDDYDDGDDDYDNRRSRKYRDSSSRAVSGTRRRKKRRRSYRPTRLAAPIQKHPPPDRTDDRPQSFGITDPGDHWIDGVHIFARQRSLRRFKTRDQQQQLYDPPRVLHCGRRVFYPL